MASEIEKRARSCSPKADDVLFRQEQAPEALYLVKSGEVALAIESGGQMVVCVRVGAGSLIGLPAVIGNKPYTLTAAPCGGADIREIAGTEFIKLIDGNPTLSMKVLRLLASEGRLARRSYFELIT